MRPIERIPIEAIRAARERIAGAAIRTPLIPLTDEIWLKLENLQPIGSFKLRGASNAMALADRGRYQKALTHADEAERLGRTVAPELRRELGMGMVLITHDLGLVAKYADRVAVMYAGRVVETSPIAEGFGQSRHPYTRSLFRSIPRLDVAADRDLTAIEGQPPDLANLPAGCAFEPRCFLGNGRDDCRTTRPELLPTIGSHHLSACPHWRSLTMDEDST